MLFPAGNGLKEWGRVLWIILIAYISFLPSNLIFQERQEPRRTLILGNKKTKAVGNNITLSLKIFCFVVGGSAWFCESQNQITCTELARKGGLRTAQLFPV